MADLLSLAQAGPVAILIVGFVLFFRAILKGDLVPGHIYLAEREQRMRAEEQSDRNAEALAVLAKLAANGNGKPPAPVRRRG